MINNQIYIGAAVVYKSMKNGKIDWFVTKNQEEGLWEIPKVVARKGESSVRAVHRMLGEQAGMGCRVIEEVGRSSETSLLNGKTMIKKLLYYLVTQISQSEMIGFADAHWLGYSRAYKKLTSKRDKDMLKAAQDYLKVWQKNFKKEI